MSDTTGTPAPEQPAPADEPSPIPNYAATRRDVTVDGEKETWMEVRFGVSHLDAKLPSTVVEVRDVDMGDQFDLAEIGSDNVDNQIWMSLAIVALAVQSIDGIPIPRGNLTKAGLKRILKKIGPFGVRAVRRALGEMSGNSAPPEEGSVKAAAGN